jgi:hypothetical protein
MIDLAKPIVKGWYEGSCFHDFIEGLTSNQNGPDDIASCAWNKLKIGVFICKEMCLWFYESKDPDTVMFVLYSFGWFHVV